MNVAVPGEGELSAFWAIIAVLAVLGLSMLGYFRLRKWL
jgi:Mg2+ and Co2+ transporter CorA